MKTYQDLEAIGLSEKDRMDWGKMRTGSMAARRTATPNEALTALTLEARRSGFGTYGRLEHELERTGNQKERERIVQQYIEEKDARRNRRRKHRRVESADAVIPTTAKARLMDEDWSDLTVPEIAKQLGVTEKTVYSTISKIKIQHGKIVQYAARTGRRLDHG